MSRPIQKVEQGFEDHGRDLAFWIGMLLPPVAWALQLQTLYLTSEFGCYMSNFVWNHVVSAGCLVLSIVGGLVAWSRWRGHETDAADDAADPGSRKRFMAMLGLLSGGLFTLAIIAQWLPTIVGVPCEK